MTLQTSMPDAPEASRSPSANRSRVWARPWPTVGQPEGTDHEEGDEGDAQEMQVTLEGGSSTAPRGFLRQASFTGVAVA
jgi:hypothetical protein